MKMLSGLGRKRATLGRGMNSAGASTRLRGSNGSIVGRLRSLHSGEEGQAILETTLCLVFLLLPVVFGVFGFGIYIAYQQALTQGVGAAGLRVGSDRGVSSDPCLDALNTIVGASPLYLNPSNLTLTVTFAPAGSSTFASLGGKTCSTATLGGATPGGTAVVAATYKVPCFIPKVPGLTRIVCQSVGAVVTEYVY
jgi:Flp pilus assembly protein TadG